MANIHNVSTQVLTKNSYLLAITAASTNGSSVDTLGYEKGEAVFTATPTGAGTTADCKLQDSPDNSVFTDVTNAAFTQQTTAIGQKIQVLDINLKARQRYIRLVFTGAGGSAAGQACGNIHLFNPRYSVVTQDTTVISV